MILTMLPAILTAAGATPTMFPAGPLPAGSVDAVLQYDDGTAAWFSWGGPCPGVWFHLDDFTPGAAGFSVSSTEMWFYHSASYPWDTDQFLCELYSGDWDSGPADLLDQSMVTAVHYAPCFAFYSSPVDVGTDFWTVVNTEMSAGGWPSLLRDSESTDPPHSIPQPGGDWLVRMHGDPVLGLEDVSWGSVKTLFSEQD